MQEPNDSAGADASALLAAAESAIVAMSADVVAYGKSLIARTERPESLLHFTDSAGLVGILQSGRLWASLATAMNDASETKLALELHAFGGDFALVRSRHLDHTFLARVFSGELKMPGDERSTDYRTYVTSFCSMDAAVHWMQYGHAGTGIAIEFDAEKLATVEQFELCRVLYDTDEQFACLRELVAIVDRHLDALVPKFAASTHTDSLKITAAGLLQSFIKLMAPQMKDIAFSAEDEWRLFSNEVRRRGDVETPTRSTCFRTTTNRIVPYKEIVLPQGAITSLKLGWSCPLKDDEQALRVLMDECLGRQIPIARSRVAVRP